MYIFCIYDSSVSVSLLLSISRHPKVKFCRSLVALFCHVQQNKRYKHKLVPLTFVAEQTSPVLLTGALPGLAAGPVNTAGIRQALVTERTLPAVVTPATHSGEEEC